MSSATGHKQARELASRESDGLAVDRTHALDAFYHPFAYAA